MRRHPCIFSVVAVLAVAACSAPGPAPRRPASRPVASAPAAPAEPAEPPPPKEYAARMEEAEAADVLGPDATKLLQLAALSPKTHAAVLKGHLWKPLAECEGLSLVPVEPAPGILVPEGEAPKIRADVYARLKEAGALAKQRGTAIEVLGGYEAVGDAIKAWNQMVLDEAIAAAKAAPPAERKAKSFLGAVRKRLSPDADPKEWSGSPCETGRFSGSSVVVQLVTVNAGGGRGAVLVAGGLEGERFERDTYEATYWDKAKGKKFRMLTEIMSAGGFVRQCSEASRFLAVPKQDATWRCREGSESWEPENRPIPAWQ